MKDEVKAKLASASGGRSYSRSMATHLATVATAILVSLALHNISARQSDDLATLTRTIDQLCSWTGMMRSSPILKVERWRTEKPGYNVAVRLAVEGAVKQYLIRFDSERTLLSFTPVGQNLGHTSLGADSVRDPAARDACIAAIAKLNKNLRWIWYGSAAIQRVGLNFIVTYASVSDKDLKKPNVIYIDPMVSFLVTPRGTVFSAFWGD